MRPLALVFVGLATASCTVLFPFEAPRPGGEGEGEGEGEDPCEDVTCAGDLVCVGGACVSPRLDEDGDGSPVTSDCDDHDPDVGDGSQRPCSSPCGEGTQTCSGGEWQPCTAPVVCECEPGELREEPCGRCGTATRACGDDRRWAADVGTCQGERACTPGANEVQNCGDCGTQTRTCDAQCLWGGWGPCEGEPVCAPGATEAAPCEECGTMIRTCSLQCLWGLYGACGNQPEIPGACDDPDDPCVVGEACGPDGRCQRAGCDSLGLTCCPDEGCFECCGQDPSTCTGNPDECQIWACSDHACDLEPTSFEPCAGGRCCQGICLQGPHCCLGVVDRCGDEPPCASWSCLDTTCEPLNDPSDANPDPECPGECCATGACVACPPQ